EARKRSDQYLQGLIDRRRREGGDHQDVLNLMVTARDEEGQPMTDAELIDELRTMVGAGHETTALSMAWSMFWLHREPTLLGKLLDELAPLGTAPDPEAL